MLDSTMGLEQENIMLRSFEGRRGLLQTRSVLVGGVVVMMMASTGCSCWFLCLLQVRQRNLVAVARSQDFDVGVLSIHETHGTMEVK